MTAPHTSPSLSTTLSKNEVADPVTPSEENLEQARSTSAVLVDLANSLKTETVSIGDLVDALQDRAFGLLMLILALPCCLPFVYLIPQAVAVPMVFIASQIAIGRHTPWLPQTVRSRSFEAAGFRDVVTRAERYIKWLEHISRPRMTWVTRGPLERLFGALMIIFSATILVPLPGTNTVPGIAIAIMSVGFLERDGLMILAGTLVGTIWTTILLALSGGVIALIVQWFGG